jgi:DNA-binding NarL/FixJ family response regulator
MVLVSLIEEHPLAKKHLELILSRRQRLRLINGGLKGMLKPDVFVLSHFHASALHNHVKQILKANKNAKILSVGQRLRPSMIMQLLRSGVHGFVSNEEIDADLPLAICALMEGHIWIRSRYLTPNSGDKRSTANDFFPIASTDALTPQQLRVLELVRENLSNKQIASELSISERTVKFHLRNVFLALNISSRYAVRDLLPTLPCPPGQPALDPQFPPSPRQ